MEDPLSLPEDRGPQARKATYLDRKKRKRAISTQQSSSDSDSSIASKPVTTPMKDSSTSPTKKSGNKTPASRGPKKVDVNLPGPSPIKRARRDSDESIKVTPSGKKGHVRAATSITSFREVAQKVAGSPSTSKKPESTANNVDTKSCESISAGAPESASVVVVKKTKPKSKAKSIAAEEDFDDGASVADSTISNARIRRNEGERIEYYNNQPECGNLEPHAAQCMRCNKTINLGRKQTYAVRPWEIHRARCDLKPGNIAPTTPAPVEESLCIVVSDPSPAVLETPTSTPISARRLTEIERKDFLEADKQIKQLEKARALCAKCDHWIALSDANAYATGNWARHKIRCSDAVPSNRVAAAKRKLLLVNDNQVHKYTNRSVVCKNCAVTVQLKGEGDYNLTSWDEHKVECIKSLPLARADSTNSIAFPSRFSRPPASSASTSSTVVVDNTPAPSSSHGVKRSRQDDAIPAEDARPAVRSRTVGYLPPQVEPPNTVMGWFMLPFQSFVRGFKESLKDRP